MTAKSVAIELIQKLPDDTTIDEIIEALFVRCTIEERLQERDRSGGLSHESVIQRLACWLDEK
jgi:hypothetical protein